MVKARILEDIDGLSTMTFDLPFTNLKLPMKFTRWTKNRIGGSLGYTYCFSDLTIFNFGKIRNLNVISITHSMYLSDSGYPDEWNGLLSNKRGRKIHDILKHQYRRRAWYAVPDEYCYLKQNVCRRQIPKECWALFTEP